MDQGYRIDVFSIIIFLGVVQGVFLAIQFLSGRRRQNPANLFLGLFVLAITAVIWEIFLCYSGFIVQLIHFYDFSEPANFLFGPLVFLYVYTMVHQEKPKAFYWQFLPFLFYFFYAFLFFIQTTDYKFNAFLDAYHPEIIPGPAKEIVNDDPLHIKKYVNQIAILYTFVYLGITSRVIHQYFGNGLKDWFQIVEKQKLWLRNLFLLFLINVLYWLYRTIFVVRDLEDYLSAVFNAMIIYYLSFIIMRDSSFFTPIKPGGKKYEKSTLDKKQKEQIAFLVKKIMSEEKLFLKNNFSLNDLAESIHIPSHHISQVLNEYFQQNFFQFLASYRIETAQNLLKDQDKAHFTIEAIAEMVGYHSKSAFNRAFKRITGITPSEYRKQFTP